MSFGGIGTSDSKTKITAPNNSITTGDNATIYRDARRNQGNIRVARGAQFVEGSTYNQTTTNVTNDGPGLVEIGDAVKQALTSDVQPHGGNLGDSITEDLKDKTHAANQAAIDSIKQPIKTQYLIYGALGLVALVGVAVVFKHH